MVCKRGGKEELKSSGLLARQYTFSCFVRFVFPCQPLPPLNVSLHTEAFEGQ